MKLNNLKLYLVVTLIVATTSLKAQDLLVGIGGGGATFGMNSTKEFNQTVINSLPFTPVLTDNFPPNFFMKAEVIYCFPKIIALGININTTSTGSRASLADYSGKYQLDNIQKGLFYGIKLLLGKAPGKANGMNVSLEGGFALSNMTIKEDLRVFTESTSDDVTLNALGIFVQPGINYFRIINSKIRLSANLSYYYGIEKGYHMPGYKDQRFINSVTNHPVKPQWDGLRFGITAYWCFQPNLK